jgi:hypothetical protein
VSEPVPVPPSAFGGAFPPQAGPPSIAGRAPSAFAAVGGSQGSASNRGLSASFASASHPARPTSGSDRIPDDRALHCDTAAAETVVAKGQLDALLASLGFFHHAAPAGPLLGPLLGPPAPLLRPPSPAAARQGLPTRRSQRAGGGSSPPSGHGSLQSEEEDALLADLEWKVARLTKVVHTLEEHKSKGGERSSGGRDSPASSVPSSDEGGGYYQPLSSGLAATAAAVGGGRSSGMLDVTGMTEGSEEDAALMQQLAAALSQRIKSIYDV